MLWHAADYGWDWALEWGCGVVAWQLCPYAHCTGWAARGVARTPQGAVCGLGGTMNDASSLLMAHVFTCCSCSCCCACEQQVLQPATDPARTDPRFI